MKPASIGSLFSGVGGLDLGAVWATGATVRWQLDEWGEKLRARHWPHTEQVAANVYLVETKALPPVDLLLTGFAAHAYDLAQPSLYRETLRFCGGRVAANRVVPEPSVVPPTYVFFEGVAQPPLLAQRILRQDFEALGFALRWVTLHAVDVNLPHPRSRTFYLAEYQGSVHGAVPAPPSPRVERLWASPIAQDCRTGSLLLGQVCHAEGVEHGQLNPEWVEALLGFPVGWTNPRGPSLVHTPRLERIGARGEPQQPGEPPRLRSGPSRGFSARSALRRLGSAASPPQAQRALHLLLEAT